MNQTTLTPKPSEEVIYLQPTRGWISLNLLDLWRFRELVYFLTWRDVKVRYKQTVLGAGWAVLQPLMNMVVLTFIFGRLAKMSTEGIPGPVFTFTGLLPWGLFAKALSDTGRSMLANRSMITKVYFPRLIIPLASVMGGLVDFAIQFVVLIIIILYYNFSGTYQFTLSPALFTLPFFLLLAIATSLGVGLWLSALNVIYRDVGYILPFLTQFWLLVTPVGYSAKEVPVHLQVIYALNPMAGVVEGFRWALLGTKAPGPILIVSTVISLLLLITGMYYFRRMERTFADMV